MSSWPGTLPTAEAGTYSEKPIDNKAIFETGVGPPKERRRVTMVLEDLDYEIFLTETQVATLDTFYRTTLNDGVDTFTMAHPRTGNTNTFKFRSPPEYRHTQVTFYRATISLRRVS